jgi:hypothetical protein
MKKIFLVFTLALFANGVGSAAEKKIVFYGSLNCGICQGFFSSMKEENIAYTFKNVDTDEAALTQMWKLVRKAKGQTESIRFPVITIGHEILVSPDYDDFKKALQKS